MRQEYNSKYIELNKIYISDIDSQVIHLKHIKSGAQVVYLMNSNPHLALNICFKTPAYDDSGIAHILEHSIYSGSELYPSTNILSMINNETFCTYVNGITGVDKTMYQFSTFSENDFWNVLKLYLDILFKPSVLKDESIFNLEGNYRGDNGEKYGGIVYREMLNIFSSDKQILFREINKSIFNGTNYQYSTAGLPEEILEVDYNNLIEYHNTYYQLSNCYIYVYGNIDLNRLKDELNHLFTKYYKPNFYYPKLLNYKGESKFKKNIIDNYQAYHNNISKEYFSVNWIAGNAKNPNDYYFYEIMRRALLLHNKNGLEKRIKNINPEYELITYFNNGLYQYPFGIIVCGDELDYSRKIELVITEYLSSIVYAKFDMEMLNSIIDYLEYSSSTGQYRGIGFNQKCAIRVFESLLYNGDPTYYLKTSERFNIMRQYVEKGTFNDKLKEIICKPKNITILKRDSSKTTEFKKYFYSNNKAAGIKNKIENSLISDKSTLEVLKVINKESFPINNQYIISDVPIFYLINNNPNNIIKINILFKINSNYIVNAQNLKTILKLFGVSRTKQSDSLKVQKLIEKYLYDFNCGVDINHEELYIYFKFSCLKQNLNTSLQILLDIIYNTCYESSMEYYWLLSNEHNVIKSRIKHKNYYYTKLRSKSKFTTSDLKYEYLNGLDYFSFIRDSLKLKTNDDRLSDLMYTLKNQIFCKDNLNIIVTSRNGKDVTIDSELKNFISGLHTHNTCDNVASRNSKINNILHMKEAFLFENTLSSLSQSYKLDNVSIQNCCAFQASEIIIKQYCDKVLKLQGTYSSYTDITNYGVMTITTFRDPKIEFSLNFFKELAEYLGNIKLTETIKTKIQRYIIQKQYLNLIKLDNDLTVMRSCLSGVPNFLDDITIDDMNNIDEDYIKEIGTSIVQSANTRSICYIGDQKSLTNTNFFENITIIK